MRLSSVARVSSSKRGNTNLSGPRLRKKHKRLDAICEEEYNRNHGDANEGNSGDEAAELRRSSRVRRAPVLLDVSPPPAKKRRKIGKNVMLDDEKIAKSCSPCGSRELGGVETPRSWESRLRSRRKNVVVGVREERGLPSGKRKLFKEMAGTREEEVVGGEERNENEEGLGAGKSMVGKSKRLWGSTVVNNSRIREKENELSGMKEENEMEGMEAVGDKGAKVGLALESGTGGGNEKDIMDDNAVELAEKEDRGEEEDKRTSSVLRVEEGGCLPNDNMEALEPYDKQVEEGCLLNDNVETMEPYDKQGEAGCLCNDNVETIEPCDKQVEELECGKEGDNSNDAVEVVGILSNQVQDGGCHDGKDADFTGDDNKTLEDEDAMKVDESNCALSDKLGKPRMKEGRRCGLCGGGTNGKPPKRLIQDTGESENEAYCGTSGSEEPNYDLWDGFGDEPGWLGRLLGPINDRYGIAGIWVHQHCAVWSPEVRFLTYF